MSKLQNTVVTSMKLADKSQKMHQSPKEPIMMLGARVEKPAQEF